MGYKSNKRVAQKAPSFVVPLRLKTSTGNDRALEVSFDAGRMLYNACLAESLRRLALMREPKGYRKCLKMPKRKDRTVGFSRIRKQYGFSEYDLHRFAVATKNACHIGDHLDTHTCQKIATRGYLAVNRYGLGKSGRPRFKGEGQFDSLESKCNAAGIRYRDGFVMWRGMEIQCVIDPCDGVVAHGLSRRVKYCRIVRRRVNGRLRYYAQLVVEGLPCQKPKNNPGSEVVGIDIGPSTVAYVGETKAGLKQFCGELEPLGRQMRLLQQAMDRSRRATNPGNYNDDGTIKKGRRKWTNSDAYLRLRDEVMELQRRRAEYRRSLHGELANELLRVGNQLRIEKNSYKSFQRNYGKSVGTRAPGTFVRMLIRKAESAGGEVWDMAAGDLKLSQLCACGKVKKKRLSERWHSCDCGIVAQRDLFSAFLARCTEREDEKSVLDTSRAAKLWGEAEPLIRQAVSRILDQSAKGGLSLPASFGLSSAALRQSGSSVKLMLRSETGERTAIKVGDAVAACSYGCGESPEEVAVAMSGTPCL